MKKQHKILLSSLGMVTTIAASSIGGVVAYGKYSNSAKGIRLEDSGVESDFLIGENYSDEYQYSFINNLGVSDQKIGKYTPPKTDTNEKEYGVVTFSENKKEKTLPVNEFIEKFKKENGGQYPLFKIKTSYFSFDNRYLTAVNADDWAKFVKWFVGDSKTPGHLSFGPEAGVITTFQIMAGVDKKSNSVTLGSYSMSKKERGVITFYPDAFFGSSQVYSPYLGIGENRLADYILKPGDRSPKDFTLDEVKEIIDLFNKINQFHDQNDSLDPNSDGKNKISEFIESIGFDSSEFASHSFGTKGDFSPHLLALEPTKIEIIDGLSVQKYKILIDFFGPRDDSGKSLLQKIGESFPEILTRGNGYYLAQDENGLYSIKNGPNKFFSASTKIGLAQILSTINDDFDGFGIDFLKYVSVHEYGHHETLIHAGDISEGGVLASSVNPQKDPAIDSLVNIDTLNDYFNARTSGLKAVHVDAFGNEISDETFQITKSPYINFKYPDGTLETNDLKKGTYYYDVETDPDNPKWVYDPKNTLHRGFQPTIKELQANFVDAYNQLNNGDGSDLHLYEAYLLNSFDLNSGTLNPNSVIIPYDYKENLYLEWNGFGKSVVDILNSVMEYPQITPNGYLSIDPVNISYFWNNLFQYPSFTGELSLTEFLLKYQIGKLIEGGWEESSYEVEQLEIASQILEEKMNEYRSKGANDVNWVIDNVLPEFMIVEKDKAMEASGSPLSFYDTETKSWVSIAESVLKLHDNDPNGTKSIFKVALDSENADIDLERDFNFIKPKGAEVNTKFDLISTKDIKDAAGNSFFDYAKKEMEAEAIAIGEEFSLTDEQIELLAKKEYLKGYAKPLLDSLFAINWTLWGPSPSDQENYPLQGLEPQETNFMFSDYVYQFSEVMTRDFVQITLVQENEDLENTSDFLSFSQSNSSFEYYISGELTSDYDTNDADSHFDEVDALIWGLSAKEALLDSEDSTLSRYQKEVFQNIIDNFYNYKKGWGIVSTAGIEDNNYLAKTKAVSNGYEKDRQQREMLGWALYNEDGSPRTDDVDQFSIRGPRGEKPETWAEAYWFFLLKMRGVGSQNITGFFRDPDLDKVYMYGFLDATKWAEDESLAPKYLAFKNKSSGEIHTEEIYLQNQNSLFYLTQQGDGDSRQTIGDEGFVGWSTNRFTAGQYISEDLFVGEYEVYFATDKNGTRSNIAFSLGQRNSISENGKIDSQAPTKFIQESDGSVTFIVRSRFNGV